jgi:hypothetical protein
MILLGFGNPEPDGAAPSISALASLPQNMLSGTPPRTSDFATASRYE